MSRRLRRSRRVVLEKPWQSLEERGSAQPDQHPALARSRTYDASTCIETPEASGQPGSPNPLSKRRAAFHKAFEEIAGREALLACFSCAWQREVPYHGRLYISSGHLCFHASLLLRDIKAVVPVASVCALKKTNTALLVPNALSIRTEQGEKFLFVSLRRREATYQLLKSLCRHLQTSSHSDLERCTPEPDDLLELQDEPNPTLNRAEEDEEEEEEMAEDTPVLGRGEQCPWQSQDASLGHAAVPNTTSSWQGDPTQHWQPKAPHSCVLSTPSSCSTCCCESLGRGHPHPQPCVPVPDLCCPQDGGLAADLGVHRAAHPGAGAAAGGHGGLARAPPGAAVSGGQWPLHPQLSGNPSPCPPSQAQEDVRPAGTWLTPGHQPMGPALGCPRRWGGSPHTFQHPQGAPAGRGAPSHPLPPCFTP
uniref:GRAM domain-containing protein n=1 Tax=Meleagris gallopavo TaxID=9103 RepID=A0A803YD37_MELGA